MLLERSFSCWRSRDYIVFRQPRLDFSSSSFALIASSEAPGSTNLYQCYDRFLGCTAIWNFSWNVLNLGGGLNSNRAPLGHGNRTRHWFLVWPGDLLRWNFYGRQGGDRIWFQQQFYSWLYTQGCNQRWNRRKLYKLLPYTWLYTHLILLTEYNKCANIKMWKTITTEGKVLWG